MFSGPDAALQSVLNGLLAAAGAIFAAAALAVVAAIRAEAPRAARYARAAGLAKAAVPLVGLASLGFVIDGIDLRPGHEADVLARWPDLVPRLAGLSAAAGFLAGLLAGARPVASALAAGGPTLALSALIAGATGLLLLAGWRENPEAVQEGLQLAPAGLRTFFAHLALFPLVTMAVAAAAASVGRAVHGLLGIPAGTRAPGGTGAAPAEPGAPPRPAFPGSHAPVAGAPARQVEVRRRISRTRWPGLFFVVFGGLVLIPPACSLLAPRATLVGSNPSGGAMLSGAPPRVGLAFGEAISPSSKATVLRTVTLDGAGRETPTGGTPVAKASGPSAIGADLKSLGVPLPDGLPGGLYRVDWEAVPARGGARRYGDLYFGVGMPVPGFIRRGGAPDEHAADEMELREGLAAGIVSMLVGLFWLRYANAVKGR